MLTWNLMGCSTKSGKVGIESIVMISGELRRKGTCRFVLPLAPLLDSFGVDDHTDTVELLSHSMVRGVASVDSPVMNSGDLLWLVASNRED
jgi:hypothetical protein